MALTDKLTAIANAIREKTGKTESLTLDQMATEIEGIEGGSGCVAVIKSNVAEGKNQSIANIENLIVSYPYARNVPNEAFSNMDKLLGVDIPNVITIEPSGFLNCTSLTAIDLPKVRNIQGSAFSGCTNLSVVILRTTESVCAVDITAINRTPLLTGEGHVYVPSSMYESYRTAYEAAINELMPGFFNILFHKIEDYPEICG